MKRLATVDQYIINHKEWQAELEILRSILLTLDVHETVKWGAPTYTVNDKNVVGIGAFKSYVGLWFFQGALLKDKKKLLINAQEGVTRAMRQWRFKSSDEFDEKLIIEYVNEAIANQRAGKSIKPEKNQEFEVPPELQSLLNGNELLATKYASLTPYKQKEYCEFIATAKQDKTKLTRLEKIKPMLMAGKGLNDKYR